MILCFTQRIIINFKTIINKKVAICNQDEERRLMGGYLVGKGFSENEILRMPFDVLTDLFNSVMGIRE